MRERRRREAETFRPRSGFRDFLLFFLVFCLAAVLVFINYETDDPDFYYFRSYFYHELGLGDQAADDYAMYLWLDSGAGYRGYGDSLWIS